MKNRTRDTPPFGRWLKQLRSAADLTQEALAEQAGYAVGTIRKLEQGERRPSREMAERLAQVLWVPPEEYQDFVNAARRPLAHHAGSMTWAAPPPDSLALNLPRYFTPFVGRERELAELARLLAAPTCRLLTLLGPGGIGKTRIAVEAAASCRSFPDGVAFVPLAAVNDPMALVPSIADAIGFTFSGPTAALTQLLSYLRERQLLLVLDNLEHLLDTQGILVDLLDTLIVRTSGVKLMVTSRERLQLQAEWVVELEGLPVPPSGTHTGIGDYPAMRLFLAHAQRAQHGFVLSRGDYQSVAEICRLVEGMPLGIELAATWVRTLSITEIGQELVRNLELAHGTARDLPARHRSLWAVVDHSWRLLSAAEQAVLCKLAVFRGGFRRDAAAVVAGASLAVLAPLVDKSLLRRTPAGSYDMHELVRQYATAKLQQEPQEYDGTHNLHCDYYAAWLEAREQPLKRAQQQATIMELTAELDNLRAAWEWAVSHRRLDAIRRASETLHWYYEFRGWFQEGEAAFRRIADRGLQMPLTLPGKDNALADEERDHACTHGRVLAHHGYFTARLGHLDQADALLEQSLALLSTCADPLGRARALTYRGVVAYQIGDYHQSRRNLLESVNASDRLGDHWLKGFCLVFLGMVAHALGEYQEAQRWFRDALVMWRRAGNPRGLLFCLTFFSITLYTIGEYAEAQALLRESLALSATTEDRWGSATTLNHLGLVAQAQHANEEAAYLFRESLAVFRETGNRWDIARTLNHLGSTLWDTGLYREAKHAYLEALVTAMEARALPDALQALVGLVPALRDEGSLEQAFELVTHILRHPATSTEARERAVELATDLRARLSTEQIAAIKDRVQARPFESAVAALL